MKLDYGTDIKPRLDNGETPAQIAAALQSDTRHERNILATGGDVEVESDMFNLLVAEFNVLWLTGEATWTGPLRDYVDDLPATSSDNVRLKVGFGQLLAALQITNRKIQVADNPPMGAMLTAITAIVGGIVEANPDDSRTATDVVAAVHAISGGPRFAGVTETDVRDAIDAHTDQELELRRVNATALFTERMSVGGDAQAVWDQAWIDAEL